MPRKEIYKRLVREENKCPRCNRLRDRRDRVECSTCRKRGSAKNLKVRETGKESFERLFGIKK